MIRDGAPVIVDPEQAVEMVTDALGAQGFAFQKPRPPRERAVELKGELRRIYDAVTEDCRVDEVAANTNLPAARVASGLAELELEGIVEASNGRWRRAAPR